VPFFDFPHTFRRYPPAPTLPVNRANSSPSPSPAEKVFRCNLPPGPPDDDDDDDATATTRETQTLEFRCRGPSCGALEAEEDAVVLDEEEFSVVDPNFFDPGYSMAGSTGFKVCCVFSIFRLAPCIGRRDESAGCVAIGMHIGDNESDSSPRCE
jgi:hypothetical protein